MRRHALNTPADTQITTEFSCDDRARHMAQVRALGAPAGGSSAAGAPPQPTRSRLDTGLANGSAVQGEHARSPTIPDAPGVFVPLLFSSFPVSCRPGGNRGSFSAELGALRDVLAGLRVDVPGIRMAETFGGGPSSEGRRDERGSRKQREGRREERGKRSLAVSAVRVCHGGGQSCGRSLCRKHGLSSIMITLITSDRNPRYSCHSLCRNMDCPPMF